MLLLIFIIIGLPVHRIRMLSIISIICIHGDSQKLNGLSRLWLFTCSCWTTGKWWVVRFPQCHSTEQVWNCIYYVFEKKQIQQLMQIPLYWMICIAWVHIRDQRKWATILFSVMSGLRMLMFVRHFWVLKFRKKCKLKHDPVQYIFG